MLIFRNYLISIALAFYSAAAVAQTDSLKSEADSLKKEVRYSVADSSLLNHREFSTEQVQKLKADPGLNYKEPPSVAESLWDRFKRWIAELIGQILNGAIRTNVGQIIMYVIGGILLVVLIMQLLKVNAFRVLISGGDAQATYRLLDENIHAIDFEKMIAEAIDRKDFRLGTRLIFLNALKILSDQHLIDWSPGKTNHEYLVELQRTDLKEGFTDLSIYFDYAWYGNFNMSAESFRTVQSIFNNWRQLAKG